MRRLRRAMLAGCWMTCILPSLAHPLSVRTQLAASTNYRGPLGLAFGQSPADARSHLAGKLTFIVEKPDTALPYHSVEQRYSGEFAGMEIVDARFKFHQGKFFYLAVTLATGTLGSVTEAWASAVDKMTAAYGAPERLNKPPRLASDKSIVEHMPLDEQKSNILPLLINEREGRDAAQVFALADLNIRTGLWDPLASWRFRNRVLVQIFLHREKSEAGQVVLKPVWIFADERRLAIWRQGIHDEHWIPPRDY